MTAGALERLAEAAGLEPGFHDIWGRYHPVADQTRRALLAAMGWPAQSEAEAAASLRRLKERPWRRLLPPVAVITEGERCLLALTVPLIASGPKGEPDLIHWRLTQEDGPVQEGTLAWSALAATGSRTLDGVPHQRRMLPVPVALPCGYHRLTVTLGGPEHGPEKSPEDAPENADAAGRRCGDTTLIVAPACGLESGDVLGPGGRCWGISAQLYGLRSGEEWGIGDFGTLGRLGEIAAGLGAAMIGLNPLHALFSVEPRHCSPYSPSHRCFLNPLYLDIEAIPELADAPHVRDRIATPETLARLNEVRASAQVEYAEVAALKRPILEELWAVFRRRHLNAGPEETGVTGPDTGPVNTESVSTGPASAGPEAAGDAPPAPTERGRAFQAFCRAGGRSLWRHALFEALHEHFTTVHDRGHWSWTSWPLPYRNPDSPEVAAFAAEHGERVGYFLYLQWLADSQFGAAAAKSRAAGLRLGFYRDLAVADDPAGAAAWSDQAVLVPGARVGAPPDPFNLLGQDWGLAPMAPAALRDTAYAPFIALVRANMRHAGVLRIDHIMGLQHLFWIPASGGPGAYVTYPAEDLMRIVALESRRNQCLVVGEDLGTVPEGFRPLMTRHGFLSYKVLYFERAPDGGFMPPAIYPAQALATVSTHDLPSLAGFWSGRDLEWRRALQLYPDADAADGETRDRVLDRRRLMAAVAATGELPWETAEALTGPDGFERFLTEGLPAVHRYLARSPSRLMMVQMEDLLGETEQANLPGTVDEHPNWRRRLPTTLDTFAADPVVERLARDLTQARPFAPPQG